jgi:outer membrane protein assembly factor BamB
MSRLFRVSSLVVIAAACSSFAVAADWPQFRGPNRDGLSPDKNLLKQWPEDGPALAWKSEFVGLGMASIAVVGDRLYTTGDDNAAKSSFIYALDRGSGKVLWKAKLGKVGGNTADGTRGTPTVDGDRVYAIGQHGDLVCVEAASGKELWRKDFRKDFKGDVGGWQYCESPLVDGDRLICTPGGQKTGALVALDKKTGALVWESNFGEKAGYSSPVVAEVGGVRQYVTLLSEGIAAVSAKDGKLLWRYGEKDQQHFAGNTANIPTPVVVGDHVYCAAGYGRGAGLVKLVADGGDVKAEEVYFKRNLSNKHGGVVIVGDYAYSDQDEGGGPQCVEWKTGKVMWKKTERIKGSGSAAITYADGRLYVHYANGYVALVEAGPDVKAYAEKGTFKLPNGDHNSWSHPVVIDGKLYVREKETVWCYDISAK